MIKKLERYLRKERDSGFTISEPVSIGEIQEKINELVEVINAIVVDVDGTKCVDGSKSPAENVQSDTESRPENVQDPYAEQKKWIGKLCRFWNFNKNDGEFNILISINKESKPLTFVSRYVCEYTHCEPVSPEDDIIYKKD